VGQPSQEWDTSACQTLREDVAVALLTRQPVPEGLREHAQLCPPCADELAEIASLRSLLATVRDGSLTQVEQPSGLMLPRLMGEVARRRRRVRWATAAAAAAVVAVAVPVAFTIGRSDGQTTGALARPSASASAPAASTSEDDETDEAPAFSKGESSDPVTGARAEVSVQNADWGSRIEVEVYGVPGGTQCRMVVIDRNGIKVESGSWTIPPGGYAAGQTFPETVMTPPEDVRAVEIIDNQTERVMLHVPVVRT
jgi:hypothetical protein